MSYITLNLRIIFLDFFNFIQQIVLSMLSVFFYYNQILNVLLVFVVLFTTNYSIKRKV